MLFCSLTYVVFGTDGTVSNLQQKIKTLEGQMLSANFLLTQMSQKIINIESDLKDKISKHDICHLGKNKAPCGDCRCVEDQHLIQRYYCDCRARPAQRDCKEHYLQGQRIDGLYLVNFNVPTKATSAFCDQTTDGGGWTVFQRRLDGSENFFRNWTEYKSGFGEYHREHWLGYEKVYLLTSQAFLKGSELRIDMQVKRESSRRWAKYLKFDVEAEFTGYKLHVSGFSGSIGLGDYFSSHNGMKFSTYDVDNDVDARTCTQIVKGAWWYTHCHSINLNAIYDEFETETWPFSIHNLRLNFSEMKVRRK